MIGYSLSFCVTDIVNGKVAIDDVEKIVSMTFADDDHWDDLIKTYYGLYWKHNPKALEIVATLRAAGKIEQPKLTNPDYHHNIDPNDVWKIK
jgi:predicted RNase H-like nuclease